MLFIDECEVHLNPPLTKIGCRRGEPAKVPSAHQLLVPFGEDLFHVNIGFL